MSEKRKREARSDSEEEEEHIPIKVYSLAKILAKERY
jgi:hypothetical protein